MKKSSPPHSTGFVKHTLIFRFNIITLGGRLKMIDLNDKYRMYESLINEDQKKIIGTVDKETSREP